MLRGENIKEATVTIVCCKRCERSANIIFQGARFWCAWCNDWCEAEVKQVKNVVIIGSELRSVPFDADNPSLQPLRVMEGWQVVYNRGFYEIDPTTETLEAAWLFDDDMLTLRHEKYNCLLDLGWNFSANEYLLQLYEGDFRGQQLYEYRTKDRMALVDEIERLLREVTCGRL
jgi:hypothetical protein